MPTLPLLKSGQAAQYPLRRVLKQPVDTVQFLDGSEQRCAIARPLREWTISLGLIDEEELSALDLFVAELQGEAEPLSFTDPEDGVSYANCSLAFDVLEETFTAPGRVQAVLVIRENPA